MVNPTTIELSDSLPDATNRDTFGNANPLGVIALGPTITGLGSYSTTGELDPVALNGVDPTRDEIRFANPDLFRTGDAVHYDTNGNGSISTGMSTSGTYYVRVIDPYTIKLYNTYAEATAAFNSFDPNTDLNPTTSTFNFLPSNFSDGTAVTYLTPLTETFHVTDVDSDTTKLDLPTTKLQTGEAVVYNTTATGSVVPLAGLTPGQTYYVAVSTTTSSSDVTYYQVEFCNSYADATHQDSSHNQDPLNVINLQPDTTDPSALTATEELTPVGIIGLSSGVTYYVANVNTTNNTFQLATDSSGTNILTGLSVPQGTLGTYQIGLDGIAMNNLANAHGTQDLHIAFSSPSTTSQTGDELFAPVVVTNSSGQEVLGGESLRQVNPPAGSGISSSSAVGGDGGFVTVNEPLAVTTLDPTVKAYVDATLIQSAGNVTVASESIGNTSAYTSNDSGGFIDVSQTHSVTNFGELEGTSNTSEAFVGTGDPSSGVDATGVTILAGGKFTLSSDTQLTTSPSSKVNGGGFIKDSQAEADSNISSNTYTTVGSNAQVTASSVNLTSTASNFNITVTANATAYGLAGVASTTTDSNANSNVQTEIDGGTTTITGEQGVDVRAQNENFQPNLKPHSTSSAFWVPFHDTDSQSKNNDGTFTTQVLADAASNGGATIVAGPRPADTPLVPTFSGFPYLALYVQAQDTNVSIPNESRTITWNANVTINSGVDPYLVINSDGVIVRDDNVPVSDGSLSNPLLSVGDSITSGTAVVHDITDAHIGQAYFIADDSTRTSGTPPPIHRITPIRCSTSPTVSGA